MTEQELLECDYQLGSLHDAVVEALYVPYDGTNPIHKDKLTAVYRALSQDIQDDALHHGLMDSCVRDAVYSHIRTYPETFLPLVGLP